MRRTSIFSSEYEKRKRRRRRRITITVILIILLVSGGVLYASGTLKKFDLNKIFAFKQTKENKVNEENKTQNNSDSEKVKQQEKEKETKEDETKYIDITLSSGSKAKIGYTDFNGKKEFTLVEGLSDGSTFDINKSKNQVLINDAASQEIKIYDLNGQEKNITRANYVTRAGQSFSKDVILKQYQGYIWSLNAKFIDDTHIAYISQLPWFRKGNLDTYVWVNNLKTGEHIAVYGAKGKSVKINTVNDKGIEVETDGNKKTVTADGNVVQ